PCRFRCDDCGRSIACVVAAATGGLVAVLSLASGTVLVATQLGGEVFSSPVAVDNAVVIGCRNDFVYVLRVRGLCCRAQP
ncbi:unnamed protein product, partial [Phaeothamnion confervicola]